MFRFFDVVNDRSRSLAQPVLMIPKVLFLVEQVCPRTTQIYNLGAAVSVLFQTRAFEAVKGIRDSLATADNTLVLVVSERAFVADAD